MLGLNKEEPKVKKTEVKKQDKTASTSQSEEAKAILAKLEAKKAANPDDCVFC